MPNQFKNGQVIRYTHPADSFVVGQGWRPGDLAIVSEPNYISYPGSLNLWVTRVRDSYQNCYNSSGFEALSFFPGDRVRIVGFGPEKWLYKFENRRNFVDEIGVVGIIVGRDFVSSSYNVACIVTCTVYCDGPRENTVAERRVRDFALNPIIPELIPFQEDFNADFWRDLWQSHPAINTEGDVPHPTEQIQPEIYSGPIFETDSPAIIATPRPVEAQDEPGVYAPQQHSRRYSEEVLRRHLQQCEEEKRLKEEENLPEPIKTKYDSDF
jgi:hypothetical protein